MKRLEKESKRKFRTKKMPLNRLNKRKSSKLFADDYEQQNRGRR